MRQLLLAALCLLAVLPAQAAFESLGAGARAPGMGDAFTAVADDIYTVYYNPAGLGVLPRPQFGTSYSKLFTGLKDGSDLNDQFFGYAHPLSGGRHGTLALAWNSFTLNNSLYKENQYYLSYGRVIAKGLAGGDLYGGSSLKYLSRSYGVLPETSNAVAAGGIARTGLSDAVLAQRSKKAPDLDLGLLYRMGSHYSVGAALTHALQPNVAFGAKDKDRVPANLSLGFNYRSLVSNLVAQYDVRRSPAGSPDHVLTVGAERWFPRLFIGEFGARGAIGVGSRDYKQLSLGLSFRTKRVQIDYGFLLPINTVEKTKGSHKMAMSFKFGKPGDEEESLEMVLEAMRSLRYGALPVSERFTTLNKSQKKILEEYLGQVQSLVSQAKYKDALEKMGTALMVAPADKNLVSRFGRLNFVGQQIRELPDFSTDPAQATLHLGLVAYVAGNDAEAVAKVSETLALKPEDRGVAVFLEQLELVTGLKRLPAAEAPTQDKIRAATLVTRAAAAMEALRYSEAIQLSREILLIDPENAQAWQNLGTAYFAAKDYEKSAEAWEKALQFEKNITIREAIKSYLKSISRASERRPRQKTPRSSLLEEERPRLSSEEIEKLYNEGVDLYIKRDLKEAEKIFERILQSDPAHIEAIKALRRVREEMPPR